MFKIFIQLSDRQSPLLGTFIFSFENQSVFISLILISVTINNFEIFFLWKMWFVSGFIIIKKVFNANNNDINIC